MMQHVCRATSCSYLSERHCSSYVPLHYAIVTLTGENSCAVEAASMEPAGDDRPKTSNLTLFFDPTLGYNDARCNCDSVDR